MNKEEEAIEHNLKMNNTNKQEHQHTLNENIEHEKEYRKLKNEYQELEVSLAQKCKQCEDFHKQLVSTDEELKTNHNSLKYYEKIIEELTTNYDEFKWNQTKAKVVLETEAEDATKFISMINEMCPECPVEIEEDRYFHFTLEQLTEEKCILEKQAGDNNELVEKLNKQLMEITEECALLSSNTSETPKDN